MLLVPPETFFSQLDPLTKKISELDVEMTDILKRQDLDEYNKAKLYQQTLQKYLQVKGKLLAPTPIPIETPLAPPMGQQPETTLDHTPTDLKADIIRSVPATQKSKAGRLVDFISRSPSLGWNERGELMVHGHIIPGSHGVDLVKDLLRTTRSTKDPPLGWNTLADTLRSMNVPEDLVGNKTRWNYIKQSTPTRSTPPGLPETPKKYRRSPHQETPSKSIEKKLPKTSSAIKGWEKY